MNIGYIDTSFLLSIVFRDDDYDRSIDVWNRLDLKYSSLLLQIESQINIYKYFVLLKKDEKQYSLKEKELSDLLSNINMKIVDKEIALEIKNINNLKRPRSLDSIHLATANIMNKLTDDRIVLCSYDKEMISVGKSLRMNTV